MSIANVILVSGLRPPTAAVKVTCAGITQVLDFAVTPNVDYFVLGDQSTHDLCKVLKTTLDTHVELTDTSVTLVSGRVVVSANAPSDADFSLNFDDPETTLDPAIFGFTASPMAGATLTAQNAPDGYFTPGRAFDADSLPQPQVVGAVSRAMSGVTHMSRVLTAKRVRQASLPLVPQAKIMAQDAAPTEQRANLEYIWATHLTAGRILRIYTEGSSEYTEWHLMDFTRPWEREGRGNGLFWRVKLNLTEAQSPAFTPAVPTTPALPPALLDDLVTAAILGVSTRKLRTAYSGACLRVRRSSDDAELDIGFNAAGRLDTVALLAHVGASDGHVVTWYDQSVGGGNDLVSTVQPRIVIAGDLVTLNGRAALDFDGTQTIAMSAGDFLLFDPYMRNYVLQRKGASGHISNSFDGSVDTRDYFDSSTTVRSYAGSAGPFVSFAINETAVISSVIDVAAEIRKNGTGVTGVAGTNTQLGLRLGPAAMVIAECVILDENNPAILEPDQMIFYGI